MPLTLSLQEILFSQGFGARRLCIGLIERGFVSVSMGLDQSFTPSSDPYALFDTSQLYLSMQGQVWPYQEKVYLMMYKPVGVECSQKPKHHPSVYTLLPNPLRMRPQKGGSVGVQAVGRLDAETSGLLLFSDDGAFIHRITSPKSRCHKVYQVATARDITDEQVHQLCQGVDLHDETKPILAVACERISHHCLALTLQEGKYHQVRRMIAAVGNHVEALHRYRIGSLCLPEAWQPSTWRFLTAEEVAMLLGR